jgi:hypothetical protein
MSYADEIAERFPDDQLQQLDGLDDCIIGYTETPALVYSCPKILTHLEEKDGITEDEALDWFSFNIVRTVEYARLTCVLVWDR